MCGAESDTKDILASLSLLEEEGEAPGVEPGSDVRGLNVEVEHWLSDIVGLSAKFGAGGFLVVAEAGEGEEIVYVSG
jgi:hypothetical protein